MSRGSEMMGLRERKNRGNEIDGLIVRKNIKLEEVDGLRKRKKHQSQ